MATSQKNGAVKLPQSGAEFFNQLKGQGYLAQFAAGNKRRKSSFPVELQQILNYSYPGLIHGRPLNKVMIVLVGQSGAGKSTTINYLFNDQICETSDCTSITQKVTEYGKELCASHEALPSVIGALSFVDPPGALDVDQTKEFVNLATITKFHDKHPDLQPRKGLLNASSTIRENVYPNLVLMVIKATDNRMQGPDSFLRKCLKALEKYRFLDRLYPNLIVAVTHSMMLGGKKYVEKTKKIAHLIQEAVYIVLRIRDVKVVFVENTPDEYDLEKAEGCDFYSLPDGQLSHYNLIKAMEEHFDKNGDILGKLFCGWYFADDCPEKKDKANILNSVDHTELSEAEMREALQVLASLNEPLTADDEEMPPNFNFQLLGHGYCPRTESLKGVTLYPETDTVKATILAKQYTVPKSFLLTNAEEDKFFRLTYETKEAYESKKAESYGLTDISKLVVLIESTYQWVKGALNIKSPLLRAVYEKRVMNAKIQNPENHVKPELIKALDLLPPTYMESNSGRFREFFAKWGSHFVQETWMGGHLQVDYPVNAATYSNEQGDTILEKLHDAFRSIISLEKRGADYRHSFDGSQDLEIQNCSASVEGGDPLQITQFTELSGPRFTDWVDTIKWYPAELQYSFKLCPYFTLVKDARRREALTAATLQYLDGTLGEYTPPPTPTKVYAKPGDDIFSIKRNEAAKRMMDGARLETTKSNGRCSIM